eukprot:scaffold2226_cov383-Chaetoceros_neogracile.AAC.1
MISCPAWLTLLLWIIILLTQESNAANKTASRDQQDDAFYGEHEDESSISKAIMQCNMPFCANGDNCAHVSCQDCLFNCYRTNETNFCANKFLNKNRCNRYCSPDMCEQPNCAPCIFCDGSPSSECPLATFQDITDGMFSKNSSYWYTWRHSGKPYRHFSSPIMVDLNNDGVLDYFNAMHGGSVEMVDKMELGLIQTTSNLQQPLVLKKISDRIILQDPIETHRFMDTHGGNVLDLDNDGILDIFIPSGGDGGRSKVSSPPSRDNFLLFGEETSDSNSSTTTTLFRGGRIQAAESGVGMSSGREKLMYMFDFNNDGLLDMFAAQDRRVDNLEKPGILLMNNGNRTWEEDGSLSEFASTMILTDADGDGVANEFMLIRDFCFPKRADPESDAEFGPFNEAIKEFCSTRPVGTLAIYKYDPALQKMQEISEKYHNVDSAISSQSECCPH